MEINNRMVQVPNVAIWEHFESYGKRGNRPFFPKELHATQFLGVDD